MNIEALWNAAGMAAALASLPGTIQLTLLTAGAVLPRRAQGPTVSKTGRMAVVIPAHNEEESIASCLQSLFSCNNISRLARVFVIADNCTDRTAEVARACGASVIERQDRHRRGKGHALFFAFQRLMQMDFGAFVVIDADTRVEPNLLDECAKAFDRGVQALQCPYLVSNPDGANSTRLLDVALRAFNMVRPRGRDRLGFSAGILGNGFGMTREVLQRVPYTAHSIVEDLEYHIALVDAGLRVHYIPTTAVYGEMPAAAHGRSTQRARWEGGRLRILRERGVWLAAQILRGRPRFIEILFDLLLLPLVFHVLLLLPAATAGSAFARAAGGAGLFAVAAHLAVTIAHGASPARDLRALCSVPFYAVWKLAQLPRIIADSAGSAAWIRTARSTTDDKTA
jgi:cellulose synthase/poly-beta-1,6-N-acetylglucosamine synthase-like glycosyltransferase